jgi:hypothetical protein
VIYPVLIAKAHARLVVCRDDLTDDAQADCEVIRQLVRALQTVDGLLRDSVAALGGIHSDKVPDSVRAVFRNAEPKSDSNRVADMEDDA